MTSGEQMGNSIGNRLKELGLKLLAPSAPRGEYRAAVISGTWVWVAGQGPVENGKIVAQGKVGNEVSISEAQNAARVTILNVLAQAAAACGGLDRIAQCVKATVYVSSAPGFTEQAKVADAATGLLAQIFGADRGPARTSVGVFGLPSDSPVMIDAVFECASR